VGIGSGRCDLEMVRAHLGPIDNHLRNMLGLRSAAVKP